MSADARGAEPSPSEVHTWLEVLFAESPMAIGFSRDGVMLDANRAYVTLFGYESARELRGRSILEQIAPSRRHQIVEMIAMRARGEPTPQRYETVGVRKDGTEFPFDIMTTRVLVGDQPIAIAFISDMSERDRNVEELRASEERFRTLASAALEGVFVHTDGNIVLANQAGAAMYGYEPQSMIGMSVLDLAAPEYRGLVADQVARASSEIYEGYSQRRDGSTFISQVRGKTLDRKGRRTRVTIVRDVTAERRAEAEQRALAERVRHAQKLESLGVLAGGVAHDFNNILTIIANAVALAKRETSAVTHLDTIETAAERGAELCRQMLAYAGKSALARAAVDVSALVAEMSTMLEVSLDKKTTLVRELAPELPMVLGDATQIRQVVMNLVLNASEAIGERAGTVVVTTGVGIYEADAFARSQAGGEPKPGAYVHVEVRDDGVGMDAETVAQMFEPFFTTKFMGRGLGMAAVLGIVRGHGGAIDVESSVGHGTRVRVLFPASAAERPPVSARPEAEARGAGVVLIVDDEAIIRTTARLILEGAGFGVLLAGDGVEAIDVVRAHHARIGAVLLDLTMPRMSGTEAMREIRRIAPSLPIVMTSGYGAAAFDGPAAGAQPDATLAKPYAPEELIAALKATMRARP